MVPLHEQCLEALRRELGGNLHSCYLYGSAVRGNSIEGQSDTNLLIVLHKSDAAAQDNIARALAFATKVDPFILGLPGFERSARCFGAKFSSIKRNYRLLYGEDMLAAITIDPNLEKFLCEQALRNLRLRLAFSYVTRERHKNYLRFLARSVTPLFLRLSEIIRLQGLPLPTEFSERIATFVRVLKVDAEILGNLLLLKTGEAPPRTDTQWHEQVFPLLDQALEYISQEWEEP